MALALDGIDHILKEVYHKIMRDELDWYYRKQRRIQTLPRTIKNREKKLPVHYQTYGKPKAADLSPH